MKKYKVLLLGENFELNFEGKKDNFGFYTTRVVKAKNEDEAEINAVELIRSDNSLLRMCVKASELEPKIFLQEIEKAFWWQRVGGKVILFLKWKMNKFITSCLIGKTTRYRSHFSAEQGVIFNQTNHDST